MMKKFYALVSLLFVYFISSASSIITFQVMVPAPITVPPMIKTIAIIDRTVPEKKKLNVVEGVLTGEGIGEDKDAAQVALDGVYSVMKNTPRFKVIRTTEQLKGTSIGSNFPDPLPWGTIIDLCKKYNVDAILSLESFDSNFILSGASLAGGANGTSSVNLGFRLYDPYQKSIIDEYRFSHNVNWSHSVNSLSDAVNAIADKNAAVKDAAFKSGVIYANRITPSWYSVSRTYYRKCKHDQDLAEGARMMEINDWNNAISSLQKAIQDGKRKTKGRASHNLAVVYEILGKLDSAKTWAQTAYARYRNKPSKYYLYDLNRRIQAQEVLDNQMSGNR